MLNPSSTAVSPEAIVSLCADKRRKNLTNDVEIIKPLVKPAEGEPLIRSTLLADDNEVSDEEDGDFIFFEEENEEDEEANVEGEEICVVFINIFMLN